MTLQQLKEWNNQFMQRWKERDPEKVMNLFDKQKLSYFESSVTPPVTNWEEVRKLWQVVPKNQKDIRLWSEIIACNEKFGIIHWKLKRFFIPANKEQNIDGIFLVSLNKNGLCTYFNQWRTVAS